MIFVLVQAIAFPSEMQSYYPLVERQWDKEILGESVANRLSED